jgi:hypothetical protein
MKASPLTGFPRLYRLPALLLVFYALVLQADEDTGWDPDSFIPPAPWREQQTGLPAYPEEGRLVEAALAIASFPYRVYIDPESLSIGADRVVRYTAVIVSTAGARNVSYEGMRCSTREYRRYAYGAGGNWQLLDETPWERITRSGMGHYRYGLYRDYLCDTTSDSLKQDEILRRLRFPGGGGVDE